MNGAVKILPDCYWVLYEANMIHIPRGVYLSEYLIRWGIYCKYQHVDFPKKSWEHPLPWWKTWYELQYRNCLSGCMICRIPSIWSSWWKWKIHSIGQLFDFPLIDHIVCLPFLPSSSIFLLMIPQSTNILHYPLQYLLFRVGYCCQRIVALKKYAFSLGCLDLPFRWFSYVNLESKARKMIMYHLYSSIKLL